jgi:hypothetical protein
MKNIDLNNMLENVENINNCNHDWDFLITAMEKSNLFIENCSKCSYNISTLELFKN